MAEAFVELGAEAVHHVTENYHDAIYDKITGKTNKNKNQSDNQSASSRKYRNQLPSPERNRDYDRDYNRERARDDSLERQSETSWRVTKEYENEPDDPIRPVDPKLERRRRRDSARMSYANGYAPSGAPSRPRSQPPRSRYDDDGDSDYDEREGQRYRTSGRGYDDRDDRDYPPYDREVIETERYRGVSGALVISPDYNPSLLVADQEMQPPRPYDARRMDSSGSRVHDGPYGAGAVAPYRRSQNDVGTEVSRRSKSERGRRDRYDDDDRSRSRSRSDSRGSRGSRGEEGWRGKIPDAFDTTLQGLGVGLAGAVVGGLAGREFGHKHKNRDILIGALVGGLGANVAENKWNEYREEKKDKGERYEQKFDGRSKR